MSRPAISASPAAGPAVSDSATARFSRTTGLGAIRKSDAWARLGQLGRDEIERYAAFRVGYHRGLDRLRASGWRGSGYVRWAHETNRGFLRALHGLATVAARIDETDEAERCSQFLRQLDPSWPPPDLD